jgi:hypothetical protein
MSILSGGIIARPGRAFLRSYPRKPERIPRARAAKPSVAVSAPLVLDRQPLPSSRWATLAPGGTRASIASRISRFGEMPRSPSWPSSFAPGPMTALEMAECPSTRTHASSRGPCRPSSQRRTGYRSGRRRWRSSWAEHVAAFRSSRPRAPPGRPLDGEASLCALAWGPVGKLLTHRRAPRCRGVGDAGGAACSLDSDRQIRQPVGPGRGATVGGWYAASNLLGARAHAARVGPSVCASLAHGIVPGRVLMH